MQKTTTPVTVISYFQFSFGSLCIQFAIKRRLKLLRLYPTLLRSMKCGKICVGKRCTERGPPPPPFCPFPPFDFVIFVFVLAQFSQYRDLRNRTLRYSVHVQVYIFSDFFDSISACYNALNKKGEENIVNTSGK